MENQFTVLGYDCGDNIIYCSHWATEEQAKQNRSYLRKTSKEREKLTRKRICKIDIIEN